MNYYETLNVAPSATDDEIKKAYRTLAKQYHPDAGGDEIKFKEISEAYAVLSDPEKRRVVNMGGDPNQRQNQYDFRSAGGFGAFEDLHDIFSQFHRHTTRQNYRKNKSVVTRLSLTLEEAFTGKEVDAEIGLPGNNKKVITIKIPPGVDNGHQVKFDQMGDASIEGLPPGDLVVHVQILPHNKFERHGADLVCEHKISVWDAMLGTTLPVETIDNEILKIKIKPGTQSGTILKCAKHGMPTLHSDRRGNLFVKTIVDIPKDLTKEQTEMIKKLKDTFLTTDNEETK